MKKKNFLNGAFIATFAIIITKVIGLLYASPFYGIIGEKGGALYGYAYNIYNFFLIISTAGIPLAISKLTSEYNTLKMYNAKKTMYSLAKRIIIIFSILSFLICFIFAPQLAYMILKEIKHGNTIEDVTFVVRMVSFALLVVPYLSVSRGYLQGHKYITAPSVSQVIEQIVRVIVILGGSFFVLKLLNLSVTTAVGVAAFGACIGGLAAYFYLFNVVRKNKKLLNFNSNNDNDEKIVSNKEIVTKILSYSLPFIVISIANSIYNNVDMILIVRTLPNLGFTDTATETISSIFTTWGNKLNSIITAFATGLIISLIPNIVSSYVKHDMEDVNDKFNKALQVIVCIIFPMTVFLSIVSEPIWNLFYGSSYYGPIIFKMTILVTTLDSLYMVINTSLQGINKYKLVFISVTIGLVINAILDIPLMILFHNLGIYAFYGAIAATIIGYLISLIIPIIYLKKKNEFEYTQTLKIIPKTLLTISLMIIISLFFKQFISLNLEGRLIQIPIIIVYGLINGVLYIVLMRKNLINIFGSNFFKKLFKKNK